MVKIEDCTESGGLPSNVETGRPIVPMVEPDVKPLPRSISVKEESIPSSSSGHLRSYFIGMGFAPSLIDKAIEENGENDADVILETLFTYSALQKPSSEVSSSLEGFSNSDNEDVNSPREFPQDVKEEELEESYDSNLDKRAYLLMMNFSAQEVGSAFNQLGENAPLEQLVDYIVTTQTEGFSEENETKASINGGVRRNEENATETLFGMMDKTLYLLQMGFTEDEVSSAIDKFGSESSVLELADSIFASRIAHKVDRKEDMINGPGNIKIETDYGYTEEIDWPEHYESTSNASFYDDEEKIRIKRGKHVLVDGNSASNTSGAVHGRFGKWGASSQTIPNSYTKFGRSIQEGSVKDELPEQATLGLRGNVQGNLSKPPYLFYGNVVDISRDTWRKLSQFLYGIEPEFVNTQFFSALIRKEGYIHNLPAEKRFHILPRPPMTIEDTLPFTRKWWPSWDTRKQISNINTDSAGVPQLCEQLGRVLSDSQGILSKEQQMNILHQCKAINLIWVGPHKLSPLEPHQVERILGYPVNHTRLWGLDPPERLGSLKYCFQTDTVGYLLSVLKDMYPDGVRVLSVYSGIGGAEIALHRLGVHLKCVVSIEESEINRKILKRWWLSSEQSGELRQVGGIWRLTTQKLEDYIKEFGGFDVVIGGNPGACAAGTTTINSLMGMDSNLFFEFVRVFQRVRSIMGRNN